MKNSIKYLVFVALVFVCTVGISQHSTALEWLSVVATFFVIIRGSLSGLKTQALSKTPNARLSTQPGVCQLAKAATAITQRVKRIPFHKLRWQVAVTAVVTALVIAVFWIAYDRRPASSGITSSLQRSNAARQEIPVRTRSARAVEQRVQGADRGSATEKAKAPSSAFKRVRVGPNELDYIAEDVTIRHFTP